MVAGVFSASSRNARASAVALRRSHTVVARPATTATARAIQEKWLKDFSWIALAVAVVAGLATTWYMRRKAAAEARAPHEDPEKTPATTP